MKLSVDGLFLGRKTSFEQKQISLSARMDWKSQATRHQIITYLLENLKSIIMFVAFVLFEHQKKSAKSNSGERENARKSLPFQTSFDLSWLILFIFRWWSISINIHQIQTKITSGPCVPRIHISLRLKSHFNRSGNQLKQEAFSLFCGFVFSAQLLIALAIRVSSIEKKRNQRH